MAVTLNPARAINMSHHVSPRTGTTSTLIAWSASRLEVWRLVKMAILSFGTATRCFLVLSLTRYAQCKPA